MNLVELEPVLKKKTFFSKNGKSLDAHEVKTTHIYS